MCVNNASLEKFYDCISLAKVIVRYMCENIDKIGRAGYPASTSPAQALKIYDNTKMNRITNHF